MCEIGEPDDYATLWLTATIKARKQHKCSGCGAAILPGEKYTQFKSLFDGEWTMERGCGACDRDSEVFGEAHGGMSFFPSGFADALSDCVSEDDPEDAKWLPMLEAMRARRSSSSCVESGEGQ